MRPRRLSRAIGVGLVIAGATISFSGGAAATPADDLQAVRVVTARYHSIEQSIKDGYSAVGEPCVTSPLGTMGIHAVNGPLVLDPTIDALHPEILLYVPDANGAMRLVRVEYLKFDADGDLATDDDRPTLFGQPFDGPMPGHTPTMPVHYDLHVWLWEDNPSGLFAPFNPSLSCP